MKKILTPATKKYMGIKVADWERNLDNDSILEYVLEDETSFFKITTWVMLKVSPEEFGRNDSNDVYDYSMECHINAKGNDGDEIIARTATGFNHLKGALNSAKEYTKEVKQTVINDLK